MNRFFVFIATLSPILTIRPIKNHNFLIVNSVTITNHNLCPIRILQRRVKLCRVLLVDGRNRSVIAYIRLPFGQIRCCHRAGSGSTFFLCTTGHTSLLHRIAVSTRIRTSLYVALRVAFPSTTRNRIATRPIRSSTGRSLSGSLTLSPLICSCRTPRIGSIRRLASRRGSSRGGCIFCRKYAVVTVQGDSYPTQSQDRQ